MLHVLFAEGLTTPRRRTSTGWTRSRPRVADVHPRARRGASAACRPTRSAASPASSRPPTAPAALRPDRACPRTPFGTVCQWAVQLLNVLTGNLDRDGGAMFTTPAIDAVGTGLIGRGHHDAVAQPGARAAGVRRRAAGVGAARGDRDARRGPGPGAADRWPATRCSRRPTAPRSTARWRGLDFMAAVDIYVNETTRHADVILPPTTALERDHYDLVFHAARGAQHRALHPGGASSRSRTRGTTGRSSARSRCAPQARLRPQAAAARSGSSSGPGSRVSPTVLIGAAAAPRAVRRDHAASCARTRPGVDLGPLRGRPAARAGCRDGASGSTPRPALVLADLDRLARRRRSRAPTSCC